MKNVKRALSVVAVLAIVVGVIWIGQGTGVFPYPASSFMIDDPSWSYKGGALAVLGVIVLIFARRR